MRVGGSPKSRRSAGEVDSWTPQVNTQRWCPLHPLWPCLILNIKNLLGEANSGKDFLRFGDEIGEEIERHVERGAHHRRYRLDIYVVYLEQYHIFNLYIERPLFYTNSAFRSFIQRKENRKSDDLNNRTEL